ncbi:hypothetical protein Poli38472_007937 [Pythium oligandrum]|uniref:Uncharacterized protein n=1 Tax=Pythium oligandrum TaxID=41045 RepID=A0A8K1FIS0_PYTOL|nr:hypothetical protein Poli38472_007937 [Pythium oligandrum]|eukprot:TMW65295.1 hypothetical protein Poli38472_007937 [Pythium oligandrum]
MGAMELSWRYFQGFVEQNGWRLLFLLVLFFVARQKLRDLLHQRHVAQTLAQANDPQRVAVLQQETARIRQAQQARLVETLPRKKATARANKRD